MDNTPRYWFSAKRFPFGQRIAVTWEGWLLDAISLAAFIGLGITPFMRERRHPFLSLGLVFGLLAIFMSIRSWKGQPRRLDD